MSTRAYTDGGPHIDDPPAYSPPDTYPPPEHGIQLADTPVSTVLEVSGAYDEQDESVPWRRSVEGEVSDLHLASEAEKKRLWWRNAVINAIFIAAWCVCPALMYRSLCSRLSRFYSSSTLLIPSPNCLYSLAICWPFVFSVGL